MKQEGVKKRRRYGAGVIGEMHQQGENSIVAGYLAGGLQAAAVVFYFPVHRVLAGANPLGVHGIEISHEIRGGRFLCGHLLHKPGVGRR